MQQAVGHDERWTSSSTGGMPQILCDVRDPVQCGEPQEMSPRGGGCPQFIHGGLGQARAGGQQLQLAHVLCRETAGAFCKDCLVLEVRRVQDISFILKHILLT